jgi:hypothetical protein
VPKKAAAVDMEREEPRRVVLLEKVPAVRRTRHPFAVSGIHGFTRKNPVTED